MPPARSPINNIRPLSDKAQALRQASLSPQQFLAQEERNAARWAARRPPANRIIRTPVTRRGKQAKAEWLKGRIAGIRGDLRDDMREASSALRRIQSAREDLNRRRAMRVARDMAGATGSGLAAQSRRERVRAAPEIDRRNARAIIRGRAQRAAAAAARGSSTARRAGEIYDRQLAPVTPRGKGRGRNQISPGPRNTAGPPPKPPKPRKPRKPRKPKGG